MTQKQEYIKAGILYIEEEIAKLEARKAEIDKKIKVKKMRIAIKKREMGY